MFAMPKLQQVDPTKTRQKRQKEELGVTKRIKPNHPDRKEKKKAPEESENGKSQASSH